MLMYADWRQVIAGFCAARLGIDADGHLPQTIGWLCLGTALAAYEQWLAAPADLIELIGRAAICSPAVSRHCAEWSGFRPAPKSRPNPS